MSLADDTSTRVSPQHGRTAGAVITACTLLCVVDLFARQLAVTSPLRGASNPAWPTRVAARQFNDADTLIRQAADGHNLQLDFEAKSMSDPVAVNMLTLLYFRSVYALYPRRVFVGHDDRVINSGPQLAAVGGVPDAGWLREHDVKNILRLGVADDGSLVIGTRPGG